jgi:hypothetical protein
MGVVQGRRGGVYGLSKICPRSSGDHTLRSQDGSSCCGGHRPKISSGHGKTQSKPHLNAQMSSAVDGASAGWQRSDPLARRQSKPPGHEGEAGKLFRWSGARCQEGHDGQGESTGR